MMMNWFSFQGDSKAVAAVMGCCGSIALDRPHWQPGPFMGLLAAMTEGDADDVRDQANALIHVAVPEPGEIHPQQATLVTHSATSVTFQTPGGVLVSIGMDANQVSIHVDFGCDSVELAADMLMAALGCSPANLPVHTDGEEFAAPLALVLADHLPRLLEDDTQPASSRVCWRGTIRGVE
jgi:hypothetical protein